MVGHPDLRNHQMFREYRALTGEYPPRTQHPNNSLPDQVLEKLKDRPDLVDWALGRE